ncbi:glycosyltransferase family 4 protein [Dokdonia sp. Hel_I_53]|uniref:glycosyltransferase family 4 protein n=1 Tax=Dokdonia sp. Hel_I_53 TaxID=1566287 RepID=UPI001198D94A|nr:glycosyltransferase family 4 protein [Dokdonia sp. Hel_I_53]TVZ51341.1 glycosyltransferase involved in cell wall biosynthesis [Dokdonia sp. Hel_I_53]
MKKKTKILYIHHGTGIGGAPISLLNLIKNLDKEKFETKIACLTDGKHVQLFKDQGITTEVIGATTHNFCHNETGKKQWYYFPYYLLVAFLWFYVAFIKAPKYLKTQQYDILHLNSHVLTSWAFAGRALGSRIVLHNREAITKGYIGLRYSILKYLIAKNSNHIINISKDNQSRLGIFENSSVVYNFINIPQTYSNTITEHKKRNVLFLGGTAYIKGFGTLADAIPYINKNIEVLIAGGISNLSVTGFMQKIKNLFNNSTVMREKFNKISSSTNVTFLGILTDPYEYINACDVLLTPFTVPHFSRPAIEAFAYGKPVIGTSIEGMDEIIDHNVNGILVENHKPKDLANAINNLCNDPEKIQELGLNGRKKAIEMFSPAVNMMKIVSIYEHVLNS